MTEIRKSVIRSVRLDDDVWEAVKGMECSLNQYLRESLLEPEKADDWRLNRVPSPEFDRTPRPAALDPAHKRPKLGLEPLDESGLNPCRHCREDEKISPRTNPWRACSDCQRGGHFNISDCRRCAEIEHAKKLADSPTGIQDKGVDYDWKEPA